MQQSGGVPPPGQGGFGVVGVWHGLPFGAWQVHVHVHSGGGQECPESCPVIYLNAGLILYVTSLFTVIYENSVTSQISLYFDFGNRNFQTST